MNPADTRRREMSARQAIARVLNDIHRSTRLEVEFRYAIERWDLPVDQIDDQPFVLRLALTFRLAGKSAGTEQVAVNALEDSDELARVLAEVLQDIVTIRVKERWPMCPRHSIALAARGGSPSRWSCPYGDVEVPIGQLESVC